MDNVVRKNSARQGKENMRLLAIMAMGEVRGDLVDEMERWREEQLNIRARWSRWLTACRWRSRMYC